MLRKTKIICTLGPASTQPEIIRALIEAGTNIFRLNMSHAHPQWVRDVVQTIRAQSKDLCAPTGILLDTQGPAIRTGDVAEPFVLNPGDFLEFTLSNARPEIPYSVSVNYEGLIDDLHPGNILLVDNGVLHLRVISKQSDRVLCQVLTSGKLGSRRHINLPGIKVNLPPLTAKDLADLDLGAEVGVDFVALSFCREAAHLEELRRELVRRGSRAQVIAKVEDRHAVKTIDAIIQTADGIMIARGDLGIECPMEELPIIQRRIIKRCIHFGRPVIVATHLLESMIQNPLPTRAEITDVANAVFEQADAIMLSGESAMGLYPIECVKILNRVALRIERSGGAGYAAEALIDNVRQKTVRSAVVLANSFPNAKMVVFTRRGTLAAYASGLRPHSAPIFAFSAHEEVIRNLSLHWNIYAFLASFQKSPEGAALEAEQYLKKLRLVEAGDRVIVISDLGTDDQNFDSILLREVQGE